MLGLMWIIVTLVSMCLVYNDAKNRKSSHPVYLYNYTDGFKSGDKEFLLQLVRGGKAYFVEKNTAVIFNGAYEKGKIIKIRFIEGRYKNKSGYVWADLVQKVNVNK